MKKKKKFIPPICTIMKLSVLQLTILFVSAASTYASRLEAQELLLKRISVHAEHTDIKSALAEIEAKAGVKFVYGARALPLKRKVTFSVTNKSLSETLDELFSPDKVTYREVRNKIVLSINSDPGAGIYNTIEKQIEAEMADRIVKGRVIDENGEGLPGVSIILKGTQRGTVTDVNGSYELSVPDGDAILTYSFVGYVSDEQIVGSRAAIDVTLQSDQKALEEIVVVGYGTQKKRDVSTAISSVSSKELKDKPMANFASAMTGKMAGVRIVNSNTAPGGGTTIRIRV